MEYLSAEIREIPDNCEVFKFFRDILKRFTNLANSGRNELELASPELDLDSDLDSGFELGPALTYTTPWIPHSQARKRGPGRGAWHRSAKKLCTTLWARMRLAAASTLIHVRSHRRIS